MSRSAENWEDFYSVPLNCDNDDLCPHGIGFDEECEDCDDFEEEHNYRTRRASC